MPSRNVVREYAPDNYYHVYNRGVEKRVVFLDDQDYTVFLGLLKRYLGEGKRDKKTRKKFPKLNNEVQLLAYCLMPNHFHLLFYQTTTDGVSRLMRRLTTGYVMYFNGRYNRVGGLFQGPYKASRITAEGYLHHISRYIHLNPEEYSLWPYSSFRYYARPQTSPSWLNTHQILAMYNDNHQEYVEFVRLYQDTARELALLKWQLANDPDKD